MSGSVEGGGAQSSHQLDFYQAMADFKLMFPNMDEEVIEAVLRANEGAVDGTIDQLLTMNTDFGADQSTAVSAALIARGQPPFSSKHKRIVELGGRSRVCPFIFVQEQHTCLLKRKLIAWEYTLM